MLPAVDKKCSTASKEKLYRKTKERKHKKHRVKSKSKKKSSGLVLNKHLVQYSDVSSEELSSSEAGEIHSDFDDKHGALCFKHRNKIVTEQLRVIARVTSPRNLIAACSPLSNQWELDSLPENSSMSTNLSVNNGIDKPYVASGVNHLKCKKKIKDHKCPSSKKKKKRKDLKHKSDDVLSDYDNSGIQISQHNGSLIEPEHESPVEISHTPPLSKSVHINVSKFEITYPEEEKVMKHLKKEDKR